MMLSDANLLVFDEPTNHLDVESIEALEDAIDAYEGTVVLITHDRALLTALATRIWSLADAVLTDYPGDFAEWEADAAVRAKLSGPGRTASPAPAAPAARSDASRRRSAGRAREQAEAEVARCEAELAACEARLADPTLYVGVDAAERARVATTARDRARRAVEQAMSRWEALAAGVADS